MLPDIKKLSKKQKIIFGSLGTLLLVVIIALVIPPVRERVAYRWDELKARIYFAISPPEKAVFVPQQAATEVLAVTKTAEILRPTPTVIINPTNGPTSTPTLPPTALPAQVKLDKVPYIDQHYGFNNCAPSNLAMLLTFWGWDGKREDISKVVKPFDLDKNVMPYELADYVDSNTNFKAIVRLGGTVDVLKNLVSNGFPVIVEKGVYLLDTSGRVSWMGHYNTVVGYDESSQQFIVHDPYLKDGKFKHFGYDELKQGWRAFDYTFLVVYPNDKWNTLADALGPYADETQSYTLAQTIATNEIGTTTGADHFFALFNRGTNLVKQQDFIGAAGVYDEAFKFYVTLPEQTRPYRFAWYQTGPYFAYYYAGRYNDVVNLANQTLASTNEPYLEESYYWRALAETMLGQRDLAIKDLCTSLTYHPGFPPSVGALKDLGGSTCK